MPRVMWLLNHTAARRFEIPMLKRIGVKEIFLPKSYPNDPAFRSASVDYSNDAELTIPKEDLEILNAANWYGDPGKAAWEIANRHFDVAMFILHQPEIIKSIARHFKGAVLWRAYGMPGITYSEVLEASTGADGEDLIRALHKRFFFAQAYRHLHEREEDILRARQLFLPLGMEDRRIRDQWTGSDRRIFFVCPDIGVNPYYKGIYKKFTEDFKGLPYAIGGAQPIRVSDQHVLGFVPQDVHESNMRDMRVMFYQGNDANHVHYHPFEAVRAGMPLVFMGGGMLDMLGGSRLPGRCATIAEARKKLAAILNGDRRLIDAIRASQPVLLEQMDPERLAEHWQQGFANVTATLQKARAFRPPVTRRKPRIAVIVPVGYRGGSLRAAKLVAQAIETGARQKGTEVDVVFAHLDTPDAYSSDEFADLPASIERRPYNWSHLTQIEAERAMRYNGRPFKAISKLYQVPDDGIRQFMDCDLWVIVSDRAEYPLLPLKPYAVIVYDYLQRYVRLPGKQLNFQFLRTAHNAERVFVTTDFTRSDAMQFAGLPSQKVWRLPMLAANILSTGTMERPKSEMPYFVWATNLAPHKNHENAVKALQIYYEKLDGRLLCCVTGVGTSELLKSKASHLKPVKKIVDASSSLKRHLRIMGELTDSAYCAQVAGAQFLWHAGWIDNGTFTVIDAAHLQVPSLSSDYPAMHEIDRQFSLNLSWMDAHDPDDMAEKLKQMEVNARALRARVPSRDQLMTQSLDQLAGAYWDAVSECL